MKKVGIGLLILLVLGGLLLMGLSRHGFSLFGFDVGWNEDAARVEELIEADVGGPFAPAGRTFKEWVALPEGSATEWLSLLDEARDFVAG